MGAYFLDLPFLHYHNPVGFFDGGQAVRDDDGGAVLHQVFQRRLHVAFGLGVEGGGGLVQNQDRRVLEDGPCDGDALPLAARKLDAVFSHQGLQP